MAHMLVNMVHIIPYMKYISNNVRIVWFDWTSSDLYFHITKSRHWLNHHFAMTKHRHLTYTQRRENVGAGRWSTNARWEWKQSRPPDDHLRDTRGRESEGKVLDDMVWVNDTGNISVTWIIGPFGDDSLFDHDSRVRENRVRSWSNLPRHGGFLSHGDTPMAGWFMESPLQWMIWEFPHGKAPHDGKSRGLLRYVMLQWMSIWEGISKKI